MDGKTWSKPVAEGQGDGTRTDVSFAPAHAKYIRITQTGTADDSANWAISNLRIYEAPAAK
jgi:hypothetical protein